ncbi:hypothetical protein FNV43_RR06609 [Rhamnella rubrinervis]|uniref:Uncharacterized protein n=1 Tax=Rhamnella rubrinervis TaxID=2594499 RepID=A0A8K0HEW0_9ROSA|nr:hypothetical protein FNV43_RR06609 [Rhamnella rubrinervis]
MNAWFGCNPRAKSGFSIGQKRKKMGEKPIWRKKTKMYVLASEVRVLRASRGYGSWPSLSGPRSWANGPTSEPLGQRMDPWHTWAWTQRTGRRDWAASAEKMTNVEESSNQEYKCLFRSVAMFMHLNVTRLWRFQ